MASKYLWDGQLSVHEHKWLAVRSHRTEKASLLDLSFIDFRLPVGPLCCTECVK